MECPLFWEQLFCLLIVHTTPEPAELMAIGNPRQVVPQIRQISGPPFSLFVYFEYFAVKYPGLFFTKPQRHRVPIKTL
jgi:hypothetical protein